MSNKTLKESKEVRTLINEKKDKKSPNKFQERWIEQKEEKYNFIEEGNLKNYFPKKYNITNNEFKYIDNKLYKEKKRNKNILKKINIYNNEIGKNKFNTLIKNSKFQINEIILFFLKLLIFAQFFPVKCESSYIIKLTISGPGRRKVFNNTIYTSASNKNYPTEVYINGIRKDNVDSEYDFEYEENNVTLNYDLVDDMDYMFDSCSDIIKFDFSNFDSSSVSRMNFTFNNCYSLIEINLSNFKTGNVKNMVRMFHDCKKLKYLDLSSFDISQALDIRHMFSGCESLTSINLNSFKQSTVFEISSLFENCRSLKSINLSNFEANIGYMGSMFLNCTSLISIDLSKIKINEVHNMDFVFCNCISLTSLNLSYFISSSADWVESMFDGCEKLEYLNLKNFRIRNDITYNNIFRGTPENIFICLDENTEPTLAGLIKMKKCYSIDPTDNPSLHKKEMFNLTQKCIDSCNGIYKYIDLKDNKCYEDCYCISCKSGYYRKEDEPKYNNIYFNCYHNPEGYFLSTDESNEQIYKLCYNSCKTCDIERGDFTNHNCLTCKNEFPIELNNNCYKNCSYYYYFDDLTNYHCSDYCEINELLSKKCIIRYLTSYTKEEEIIQIQDKILENINKSFTSSSYNTYNIDNGNEEIIKFNKLAMTLTTTDNQRNNIDNNVTIIDFSECEKILRKIYNISDDKKIYIFKIDVEQNKMKIPKIEYDVYYKENENHLVELNLNYCKDFRSNLLIPVEINENLDILNSSGGYYNDICYTTKSNSGTDIILKDRKNEFIYNNKTVCQEDCIFIDYYKETKKVKCSCEIKEPSFSSSNMNIDINKLMNNFIDIKNIANIGLLKCYKKLFSFKDIIKNIGFLMIIPIFIFHLICIIIFYSKLFKKLKKKIKKIILSKATINSLEKKQYSKHKKTLYNFSNKKEQNHFKKTQGKINFSNNIMFLKEDINNTIKNHKINRNKKNKREFESNNELYLKNNHQYKSLKKKIRKKRDKKTTKNIKKKIEFNEQELNDLDYELALRYDKRLYCEYYLSLLKTRHNLIFSFYYNKDYNSKLIKISLFFFGFVSDFAINALFFNDNTMHKIYEDKGKFKFLYQLPQIIYSFLISYIFNIPLNILALSDDDIFKLKNDKSNNNLQRKQKNLLKKLRFKFLLYFIFNSIFLLFLWYYISIFCAVYVNTQIHLVCDTLISFGLSFIYPFGIYLVPGIFRIPSLTYKKQKKYLYTISKILQAF